MPPGVPAGHALGRRRRRATALKPSPTVGRPTPGCSARTEPGRGPLDSPAEGSAEINLEIFYFFRALVSSTPDHQSYTTDPQIHNSNLHINHIVSFEPSQKKPLTLTPTHGTKLWYACQDSQSSQALSHVGPPFVPTSRPGDS